jgi:Family of unknown function (DUF6263)
MTGFLASLTLAMTMTPTQAEGVSIRWKLKADDIFYTKTITKMDQVIKVQGREVPQKNDQTVIHRYKVLKANADGYQIEQTILQSSSEGTLVAGPAAAEAHKKMKGSIFTFTFNPDFQVQKIEGIDEYVDKLSGGNAVAKQLLESSINAEVLKISMEDIFRIGTKNTVKVGDKWKKDYKLPLAELGDVTAQMKYQFDRNNEGIFEISYQGDGVYSTPKPSGKVTPITITNADVKIEKFKGTLLFDSKLNRVQETKTEFKMVGPMTMQLNGQTIAMEVEQNLASQIQILSKNPIEE